jgi:hypothetical protein
VVIELADIDLSAVNMMPPRQGMHIPQLGVSLALLVVANSVEDPFYKVR